MKKRLAAVVGIGMTAAASVAISAPAGAATHSTKLGTFKTIAAAPKVPFMGKCGYPVNNPTLVLGPAAQSAKKNATYHFSGSYGCNGHGLPGFNVTLSSTTKAGDGTCTKTAGASGHYACLLTAKSGGTATASAFHATSNTVGVKLKG